MNKHSLFHWLSIWRSRRCYRVKLPPRKKSQWKQRNSRSQSNLQMQAMSLQKRITIHFDILYWRWRGNILLLLSESSHKILMATVGNGLPRQSMSTIWLITRRWWRKSLTWKASHPQSKFSLTCDTFRSCPEHRLALGMTRTIPVMILGCTSVHIQHRDLTY